MQPDYEGNTVKTWSRAITGIHLSGARLADLGTQEAMSTMSFLMHIYVLHEYFITCTLKDPQDVASHPLLLVAQASKRHLQ